MKQTEVPAIWQHLPFLRGYPVPYFVHWEDKDGVPTPNFHIADSKKWIACLQYKKCWVCGKKLDAVSYMVTGPKGLKNRAGTDTFMHEACARESLRLCPHLFYQKTARRDPDTDKVFLSPHHDLTKPDEMVLVRTGDWRIIFTGQTYIINYQPVAVQLFHYVDGLLAAKTEMTAYDSTSWKVNGFGIVPLSKL